MARADQHWRERVARHAAGEEAAVFVADAGRLVGKAGCFVEPEITDRVSAQVFGVYVAAAYRGRGVAGALLTASIRWADNVLNGSGTICVAERSLVVYHD